MPDFLIDTHSHIDLKDFDDDLDSVIENARNSGVEKIIVPSVDSDSFEKIIKICGKYPQAYGALGIHPTEAQNAKDEDFEKILELAKAPAPLEGEGWVGGQPMTNKIVAIGECGLDYYWDKTYAEKQKEVFIKQIKIANELNLPLLVHDREAHKDTFDILAEHAKTSVVMHCFSGSFEFARECIKKGFYIALGGVVTFKNAKKAHEVAANIPLEYLLLETDAPYLTPEPYRGKRNEPAYTKYSAQRIAEIRGVLYEEIANQTTLNARKVFRV